MTSKKEPKNDIPNDPNDIIQDFLVNKLQLPAELSQELVNTIFQSVKQNTPSNEISVRGSWSQQEDDLLTQAIERIGPNKWVDIARFVPTRTSKQCRERWYNYLNPELSHEPFSYIEDQIIIEKQSEIGNKWSLIAKCLPGRSPGAVKNRWYAGLKNQVKNLPLTDMNPIINQTNIQ